MSGEGPASSRSGRARTGSLRNERVSVVGIDRAEVVDGGPGGSWPCPACDAAYEISTGWVIQYHVSDRASLLRTIVCSPCAAHLDRVSRPDR